MLRAVAAPTAPTEGGAAAAAATSARTTTCWPFGVVKMPKFEGAVEGGRDHVTVEGIYLQNAEDTEGWA